MSSASTNTLPCPKCKSLGILCLNYDSLMGRYGGYIICSLRCSFFVKEISRPKTTELAKEILRSDIIKRWNKAVEAHNAQNS